MEALTISKAYPHSPPQFGSGPPMMSVLNTQASFLQSSSCLCFYSRLKDHKPRPISNSVKLFEFSSLLGTQKRSFSQVVQASESDTQLQNEVLQQETKSDSESAVSPSEQGASELPLAAEQENQKEAPKIGSSWLLRSTNEEGLVHEITAGDGILVGAAPTTNGPSMPLVVDFPMVSSAHARVFRREKHTYKTTIFEYFVMDLGSTNGTYLNRSKLRPQTEVKLSRGDILKFGDERAVFVVDSQS